MFQLSNYKNYFLFCCNHIQWPVIILFKKPPKNPKIICTKLVQNSHLADTLVAVEFILANAVNTGRASALIGLLTTLLSTVSSRTITGEPINKISTGTVHQTRRALTFVDFKLTNRTLIPSTTEAREPVELIGARPVPTRYAGTLIQVHLAECSFGTG